MKIPIFFFALGFTVAALFALGLYNGAYRDCIEVHQYCKFIGFVPERGGW